MALWSASSQAGYGGRFQVEITDRHLGRPVDVTEVRGAPTQIGSFSDADPFGDAAAQLTFPAVSVFDDLDAADLGRWLHYWADVDIWWVPAIPASTPGYDSPPVTDPLTNAADLITPFRKRSATGVDEGEARIKVWEGFVASMEMDEDGSSSSLQLTCQGALFELDHYLQKPFYPGQPWPLELLVADCFDRHRKPFLRWAGLRTVFPADWTRKVPALVGGATAYTPAAQPGTLWTGLTSRDTGSWEHTLTGYVQDQLTVMLTSAGDGVTPGNQWTVRNYRTGQAYPAGRQRVSGAASPTYSSPGRQPVLMVRDTQRPVDLTLWVGTPGVQVQLTGDGTQSANVVYGQGTDIDGNTWRNAVISTDGSRTDYLPLAASRDVYPASAGNTPLRGFVSESFTKFGPGFSQEQGVLVAAQQLSRDVNPGWSGTVTLSSDPSSTLSRWQVAAGMTLLLCGFAGTGAQGVRLHVSATTKNPADGTVQLTVDTRYRDLLTVEESIARTRDPLTPVKMLQVNKASVMIGDIQAPWDYAAGSGFIPTASKDLFRQKAQSDIFPYSATIHGRFPPSVYPQYYVKCNASAPRDLDRWAGPIPVLTSATDTIARTEMVAVDYYGRPVKVPFHLSFYYVNTPPSAMPHLNGSWSAYQNNAFEKVDPATGFSTNPELWPDPSFVIGWGNVVDGVKNRAGFWPGRESDGNPATGEFVDESTWQYNLTQYRQYFQSANPPGSRPQATDVTIYAMIYAEYSEPVYFLGRLYRANPGSSS